MNLDILLNEDIRFWLAFIIIGSSVIWGLVIVSVAEKFFDRNNDRSNSNSKYAKDDKHE